MASSTGGGEGGSGTGSTIPPKTPGRIPTDPRRNRRGTGTAPPPGSGSGTGTGGQNPYAAAQAAASAEAMAARRREAQRWLEQAGVAQQQIDALKIALGPEGLRKALLGQLGNVRLVMQQADKLLMKNYRSAAEGLQETGANNMKEAADKSVQNLANRGRELSQAMSEATLQGAGESDMLAAQGASLRNWDANQSEINRAFYDTQTSVNSALTDLTNQVRTNRFTNISSANDKRADLWQQYFANRGQILTQLGNTYGQQAEYYSLANQSIPGTGGSKGKQSSASDLAGDYWERASEMTGRFWENPGVPKRIQNWKGVGEIEGSLNNSNLGNQLTMIGPTPKPEGATLRGWK